jgi:hypothetical protein
LLGYLCLIQGERPLSGFGLRVVVVSVDLLQEVLLGVQSVLVHVGGVCVLVVLLGVHLAWVDFTSIFTCIELN